MMHASKAVYAIFHAPVRIDADINATLLCPSASLYCRPGFYFLPALLHPFYQHYCHAVRLAAMFQIPQPDRSSGAVADNDGDVLMMHSYDLDAKRSAAMDCDNDQSRQGNAGIAIGRGMSSRGSADSLASTASSASMNQEPELSQSFGSTKSYDLTTPIKPFHTLQAGELRRETGAVKGFSLSTGKPISVSAMTKSPEYSPRSISDVPLRRDDALTERPSNTLLGLQLNDSTTPFKPEARRLPPPGLAGRLKINLPSSNMSLDGPITPGGHAAFGARDGAAHGGPPLSPFEPPTPFTAPKDMLFAMSSNTTPLSRPKMAHRHSSGRPAPLVMSPLAKELSSLGMRKTMSSKGSDTGSSSCSQRSAASDSSSFTASTLLTPPYSPYSQPKSLAGDSDVSLTASQRTPSGGSTSSSGSGAATAATAKAARTVSPRPKATKGKAAPYPSPRDEMPVGKPSAAAMSATQSQPASSYFGMPAVGTHQSTNAQPLSKASKLESPSILRDVVKPLTMAPESVKMEKCVSEPMPRTVSARHLANRSLHPTFERNYALGDELGSGGFGFVVGATRIADGLPVAVKFIWKDKVPSHGWVRDDKFGAIPMEAFVLKVIDSPFVVKFVDLFADKDFFYLIMEHHGTPWKAPHAEDGQVPEPVLPKSKPAELLSPIDTKKSLSVSDHSPSDNGTPAPSPTFAVFPPESDTPVMEGAVLSSSPTAASPASDAGCSDVSTSSAPSLRAAPPMERRSSCDLFECIEQHSHFSEDRARWVFAQIVEAVYDLDKRGICHRDIKDENCVVDQDFNVKLIDFGSAVITDPRKPTPFFNRFFGTMTFASSEILLGKQYRAPHAEVWSLGVLLSILLSGECPFSDPQAAIRGKISKPSKPWGTEATDLLLGCLEVDPDRRANIREVRNHPWVAKAWAQRGRCRPGSTRTTSGTP